MKLTLDFKSKFDKLLKFVIKYHIPLVIAGAVGGGIVGFGGMILYNQSSSFCLKCHYNKGRYIEIDMRSQAHQGIPKGEGPGCMSCHPDKAIEKILARNLRKTKNFSQRAANLNLKNITNTKDTYTTEECLNCHPGRLDVMQRENYLLPSENLEKLGLILNKKMHQRYELFNDEDAVLYDELRNKTVRSEDAEKELLLLEKIRFGNCGQCHIQKKEQSLDKGVNYIARNPVSCAGCHEEATTLSHPGKMMKFPTKEACQKCHHGKIHGKFQIFKADCDEQIETEHCVKCHPYYDKKKFSAIARK